MKTTLARACKTCPLSKNSKTQKTKAPSFHRGPISCLNLAGAGGFEPPTTGFGDQRSGQAELRSCDVLRQPRPAPARDFNGTPGGIRTPDARLRTPPLYPLSYRGIMVEIEGLEPSASALRTPRSPN